MEKVKINPLGQETVKNIHEIIPTQDNETVVFLARISDPIIRERLINDLYLHETTIDSRAKGSLENGGVVRRSLKDVLKMIKYRTPIQIPQGEISKDVIARKLDRLIPKVFNETGIVFQEIGQLGVSPKLGHPGLIVPHYIDPIRQVRAEPRLISMAEAHEKGHGIRRFVGESEFTRKLAEGFDFASVPQGDLDEYKNLVRVITQGDKEVSNNEVLEYFEQPIEIIERMSQLKNYFGMKSHELFTSEHLNYAREHYLDDYQFPAQMRIFLSAITLKTEARFIELMNTLGI